MGKLSSHESGEIIYPKLAAVLSTPKASAPRETVVIQQELQEAKKLQSAKIQELEEFTKQNQIVFQAGNLYGSATNHHVSETQWQRENLRTELREIEAQIAQLENELYLARQIDWGKMMQNDDFEEYAAKGAAAVNPAWEKVNGPDNIDPLASPEERSSQVGNIVTFSMENKEALDASVGNTVGKSAYTYMTDNEVQVYNYLLGKYGKDTAQTYLDGLENTLNYRYGAEAAKQYTDIENPFWRTVASLPYGFAAGIDQYASGIRQLFHKEELPVSPMQYASQTIQQSLGTGGQIAYGVSNAVGNMLPSMVVGKGARMLGGALGLSTESAKILATAGSSTSVGASGAGNAYTQALREGYTTEQARTYAALVGASEAGLSFVLSGVGKLQGVSEKALLSKIRTLDSTLAKMALTGVVKVGGEIVEEELQLHLEPLFRTIVSGEDYETPAGQEILQTAVIAAISNGVIEGPAVVGIEVDFGKFGQLVMQDPSARGTVANALTDSRPGSTAGELAQSLVEQAAAGQPLSTEDIGKLYTVVQTDNQTGKTVKSEGKTTELLQSALELPVDSQAHQLAAELSEQLNTALTELGMDVGELYQMSRVDQINLIDQVTDKTLNDQTIGELTRLAEQGKLTDVTEFTEVGEDLGNIKNIPQKLSVASRQFGHKVRRHAKDYNLDPSSEEDRTKLYNIIVDVVENATERRLGDWRGQEGDVIFHIKGDDVVVTKQDWGFISVLKGGINNERVKNARK